jgi:hypothetical protein
MGLHKINSQMSLVHHRSNNQRDNRDIRYLIRNIHLNMGGYIIIRGDSILQYMCYSGLHHLLSK